MQPFYCPIRTLVLWFSTRNEMHFRSSRHRSSSTSRFASAAFLLASIPGTEIWSESLHLIIDLRQHASGWFTSVHTSMSLLPCFHVPVSAVFHGLVLYHCWWLSFAVSSFSLVCYQSCWLGYRETPSFVTREKRSIDFNSISGERKRDLLRCSKYALTKRWRFC